MGDFIALIKDIGIYGIGGAVLVVALLVFGLKGSGKKGGGNGNNTPS